jgi:hypothetical protein
MAILDMRGPDVILREGFNEEGVATKKRRKKGNVQNVPGETSVVGAMKWVVSGMGSGELALRSLGVVSDQGDPANDQNLLPRQRARRMDCGAQAPYIHQRLPRRPTRFLRAGPAHGRRADAVSGVTPCGYESTPFARGEEQGHVGALSVDRRKSEEREMCGQLQWREGGEDRVGGR